MLPPNELAAMIASEENRLGVGSKEFMNRHNEIIEQIDDLMKKGDAEHEIPDRILKR